MEENREHLPCLPNWGVRFLCDCGKQNKNISVHQGIALQISTHGVSLLSDHPVCEQKKIAMQLMIPSLNKGAPHKIVKIIGNTTLTIANEGKFLTKIEFLHFEENGQQELKRNLHQCVDPNFYAPITQRD
ncbi:hypothetical protein [Sideroxydans sp. CL21]|uniref:hypothetical protein n=1 Tax=Sideroxydans sp. CL21 TaxID=2600596 RepID=UPI0024BBF90D|nr:hypothetical protein [Sideroxydans sp. CL21]